MNPINPHGVAKIDLSPFLRGVTEQKYKIGVYPCEIPQKRTANLLPGEWIDSGTICTVRVRIENPLTPPPTPFTRVALVMKYFKSKIRTDDIHGIKVLVDGILEINAEQINLHCPVSERAAWISTHVTSDEELSKMLAICGYHIYDKKYTYFLLEVCNIGCN
jgi:hypothetical protein